MKRLILLATILISACSHAGEPVQGAVYAEIRGVSGGRIRIYKGAHFSHQMTRNIFSKVWTPTVCFFDKNGRKLVQEEFTDWHLVDEKSAGFTWPNYEKAIQDVRSRLTQNPKAHHAVAVHCIKGPARISIELFDKQGMLIACIPFGHFWRLKTGDVLPQEAITMLSDYVRNPAILSSLRLTEEQNTLFGRRKIS